MADIKIAGRIKAGAADGISGYASEILFDDAASNKTVKEKLEEKQDTLTFDNAPTANSNNPVKSGGVYRAIQSIDVSGQISGKADKSEMSVVAGTGANADKTTITLKSGTSATVLTQHQDISGKEDKSNKVTSFSLPTDTQYPSAKLVNDQLATKQDTISDLATIRSGAAAGATAVQPATTLAGYGITDGYTKTEGQTLENTVDNRLDTQDAAIALLNGSEVIVVADHTQVASPNSQKIYREQGSTSYTDWMYQDSTWKEIATYDFPGIDDEPTAGSDNLVKSGGVANVNGSYTINEEWIRVVTDAEGRILCGIKANGSIEWSIGVPTPVREYVDAQIAAAQPQEYDEIVAFLGDLINGDSLQELLSGKVDKVEGKSLIDEQYVESGISDEFIQAVVDADGRILQGIKPDGSPYFPKKELLSIEDNTTDYIEATLDEDGKIVEGIKKNGEHNFNAGLGVANIANMSSIEQSDFVEVKVDSDNKILEGTRKDGSKYIGAFDDSTKSAIKEIAGGEGNSFSIPLLDSNFTSPVPCKIFNGDVEDDSVKGEDNAKYVFDLNIKEAFNIRFKFKITEDIYNAQKECYIAKLGGQKVLHANPRLLTQFKTTVTYNGEQKDMFWPSFIGGISLNDTSITQTNLINNSNIGGFAFSIRYTGESHDVTIQNTGSAFILKIGDVTHTLSYTDYPTVAELYTALGNIAGVELSFNDIENRNSDELAIFAESKLVSLCYTGVNGESPEVIQEYWDSGSFYIPYSVGETWHQVEIVNIENKIYVVCDGYTVSYDSFIFNNFVLGGECGVLFKDFEVSMNSSLDAESTRVGIISGVNPYILIFEGHGLTSKPSHEVPDHTDSLLSTPDRLQHLFMHIKGMGYVPISIEDVADYFDGKKVLPKRCFVPVFDDFQLENCLDLKNRAPFTKMGVEPTLAIVSNNADTRTIVYNNQEISFQQANDICKTNHFTLVSHTRNHRNSQAIKPSEYINELEADIHDQDLKRIVSNILVFPYGRTTRYLVDTMQWVGFRLGINVARDPLLNGKYRNKYNLYREELGLRDSYEFIISRIV